VRLLRDIEADQVLTYADVALDESLAAVKLRRVLEAAA
jgi:predicted homoserine dehydrogenase-like protein